MTPAFARRYPFHRLHGSDLTIVERTYSVPPLLGEPPLKVHTAPLGHLGKTFAALEPFVGMHPDADRELSSVSGSGVALDDEGAWVRSVVESVERYCLAAWDERELRRATANELGADAIDLDLLPRCSPAELSDAHCRVQPPSKDTPIRWVRGISLATGKPVWLPAIMTHLFLQAQAGERFWPQISTGVAAHTDLPTALVSAAAEMIERDAITLTWLGRLPLREIDARQASSALVRDTLAQLATGVEHRAFDATTDLGVPTVFAVQRSLGDSRVQVVVSCSTNLDPEAALAKTVWEASSMRVALRPEVDVPGNVADFHQLHHGAAYYARHGAGDAFDFLLRSPRAPIAPAELLRHGAPGETPRAQLREIVRRIVARGFDPIAVDLTTDEVREAGLWVVRVMVPGLLPLITLQRSRFLGTPRLYQYASAQHGRTFVEADVNPNPMPFA